MVMAAPAKAKRPKKAKAKARAKKKASIKPTIVIVDAEEAPQYYANHVEVSHNLHEFEMIFSRLPSRFTQEDRDKLEARNKLDTEALVRIIIPPSLLLDFISVLNSQKDKYEKNVGPLLEGKPKG